MKRLLALLLCLVMCLSLIPAAAAEDIEIVDLEPVTGEDAETPEGEDLITIIDPEAAAEEPENPEDFNAYDKPLITEQPTEAPVCVGDTADIYVIASNAEEYQWYYRTSSSGSWNKSSSDGAKSYWLKIVGTAARNGYQYRCKVSNDKGYVYSKPITLIVSEKPAVQWSQDVVATTAGSRVPIYVQASGAKSFQWYSRTSSSAGWSEMSGETRYYIYVTPTADMDGWQYRCKLSNDKGSTYSEPTTLRVTDKPVIEGTYWDEYVNEGEWAYFYIYTSGAESYQWYYRTSESGSWNKYAEAGGTRHYLQFQTLVEQDGWQFRCKVSNSAGYVYSDPMTLNITSIPVFYSWSGNMAACVGDTVSFHAYADNAESYQWYWRANDKSDWAKSSATGATTDTLQVSATLARNGYQYRCKASNDAGYVYSEEMTLTVTETPALQGGPYSTTAAVGSKVLFECKSSGADSYQWYWRSSSSADWAKSSATGAKTSTLSIDATAARNGYQYRCKLTNSKGSVYSQIATLTVVKKPIINWGPEDETVSEGGTAYFYVQAIGAESYQWYYRSNSSASWSKSTADGANSRQLNIKATAARNGYQYRCKVSNSYGYVYSEIGTLYVTKKPTIEGWTGKQTVTLDSTATFSVYAVGAESYQWYWRANSGGTWATSSAEGAKTDTLNIKATAARNGYQYRCKVSNSAGYAYSAVMTLYVTKLPVVQYGAYDRSVCVNDTAEFYVEATGADSYQWYWRANSSADWAKSSAEGAKTDRLRIVATTARNGYQYCCKVTNSYGEAWSQPGTLTVSELPIITYGPYNKTVSFGGNAYFYVGTSGAESYQWYCRTSVSGSWTEMSGKTDSNLSFTATLDMDGYQYRCKVSNSKGSVYSDAATLTVTKLPCIESWSGDETGCVNSTVNFTVYTSGAESYQWYWRAKSSDSWSKSSADGATTRTLNIVATKARNGYQYRCKVSNSYGDVYSNPMTLTVTELPVITSGPYNTSVYVGNTISFHVYTSGAESFQWYWRAKASDDWAECTESSATTDNLQVEATAERNGSQYRCKVSNSKGSVYSSAATLTVTFDPIIHWGPDSVTVGVGATTSFYVSTTGGESFQWYWRAKESDDWSKSSAEGATTNRLYIEATAARNGYQYRCKVSNSYSSVYSKAATLTVTLDPIIAWGPNDTTLCVGDKAEFYVSASNAESYQWYWRSSASGSWSKSSAEGATTNRLYIEATAARNGYQYRCKVSNSHGSVYSAAATLTVSEMPVIRGWSGDAYCYEGETAYFSVYVSGAESYQWYWRSSESGAWSKSSAEGATTDTLYIEATAARNGYQYRCKVTNGKGSVYSEPMTLYLW